MDALLEQAIKNLLAAGPVAIVMGIAIVKLWAAAKEERDRHAAQEEKLTAKYVELVEKLTGAMNGDHDGR